MPSDDAIEVIGTVVKVLPATMYKVKLENGHEVLAEIKADESLRRIPVVMLTTSQAEEDLARAYANHVNCYIRKPVDFERFAEVVRSIEDFWFAVVTLPQE